MKEDEKEKQDKNHIKRLDEPKAFAYEKSFLSNYFMPRTTKRGRFTIEDYSALESKFEISKEYKKGRFHVIETKPSKKEHSVADLLQIIELQNKQIEMLYSMINKENEEYEKIQIEIDKLFKRI
ncbi:hypothetical protein NBO_64g0005 [Nosema bombycis CQ1]|uniref:Uncharacterized protein n=1 Tax=Nosema bombycis (strain CQ1 / CVCC 102059) TaxID=578461 RepID=R0MLB6_NOSB1|nr:hypothetical protein NBO_64g0005 [Nosema bombycis CQ1]|eukprot:EOB13623.1 hypothetical protein NBO_64g0005 [Nosema bombycis CQ1]